MSEISEEALRERQRIRAIITSLRKESSGHDEYPLGGPEWVKNAAWIECCDEIVRRIKESEEV